jgi:hypothetical protein
MSQDCHISKVTGYGLLNPVFQFGEENFILVITIRHAVVSNQTQIWRVPEGLAAETRISPLTFTIAITFSRCDN